MAEKRVAELLEMFGLKEKPKRLFNTLSTGMAKKAMICAALLHNPRVLLLDRVGVMMEGKLIHIGTPGELKHRVNELSVL